MEKNKKVKMSPAARKLAREMGINVGEIEGSSSVIRSKDILDRQEQQFMEELLEEVSMAADKTKSLLSQRYKDILYAERKTQSLISWQEAKASQEAFLKEWLIGKDLERTHYQRDIFKAVAEMSWRKQKDIQTRKKIGYFLALNDEKREQKALEAGKMWAEAKYQQDKARVEYLVKVNAEKRATKALEAKKAWQQQKDVQSKARVEYFVKLNEEKRAAAAKEAKKAWELQKAQQSSAKTEYFLKVTQEKRAAKALLAKKAWQEAKAAQGDMRRKYLAKLTEEKRLQRAKAAEKSWSAAKASMDQIIRNYNQSLEDAKINEAYMQAVSQAKQTWQELKAEGDAKIEEFMDVYNNRKFEEAYDDYIQSLDEYNQVSVGKLEFEIDDIEEDIEDKDIPLNEAITKYVAQATAKALIDLECPIYENGMMNIISLTGAKPIKTVRDAQEGDYLGLEFEDAIYFTKDIKVRVWDLSACGLESFFASQGGINVYINVEDDEVDLDIAIDTRIMMDLEALIFMMRMKEYLVK